MQTSSKNWIGEVLKFIGIALGIGFLIWICKPSILRTPALEGSAPEITFPQKIEYSFDTGSLDDSKSDRQVVRPIPPSEFLSRTRKNNVVDGSETGD